MKPIAVTVGVEQTTDGHFRRCVFAFDRLHGSPSNIRRFHDHTLCIAVRADSLTVTPPRRIRVRRTVSVPRYSTSKST